MLCTFCWGQGTVFPGKGEREQGTPSGAKLLEQSSQCRSQCKERNKRKVDAQGSRAKHCGMLYNTMDIANL